MGTKITLTSQAILQKRFQGATPGYNALEVDTFLDKIIKDYKIVEGNILISEDELTDLKNKNQELEDENQRLNLELIKSQSRLTNIKEGDVVNSDNVNLIKRINALEKFIYEKGFDPTKIK